MMERMAETERGQQLPALLSTWRLPALFLLFLLSLLPAALLRCIVRLVYPGAPHSFVSSAASLANTN